MSETNSAPYPRLLMRILANTYAAHPWRSEGEDIPADIALDASGLLPIWWNQIEKNAALLNVPLDHLPAMIMEDSQSMTGRKLVWRDAENLSSTERHLLRALLPALAMDAIYVLHQQENVMAHPRHLEMFPDKSAMTKNLIEGLSVALLMETGEELTVIDIQQEEVLPNEAAKQHTADVRGQKDQPSIH